MFLSPREKTMKKEALEKKTKFMTPKGFVTTFGRASSIKLRKEGQIRGFSEFPTEVPDQAALGLKVQDCGTLRLNDKSKQIGGVWKKY